MRELGKHAAANEGDAVAVLKRLCAPSDDAALDRLVLGPPSVTTPPDDAVFSAPLELPLAGQPLTLSGAIPARRGAALRLVTSPPFDFEAGGVTVRDALVEVTTETGRDRVRQVRVRIRGNAGPLAVEAEVPRANELLRLTNASAPRVSLDALAPLAGGAPSWEAELDALLQRSGEWTLTSYSLDVVSESGIAASARVELRTDDCSVAVGQAARLAFRTAELRWTVGFPNAPQRVEHVELEGEGQLLVDGRRAIASRFDTTVTIVPHVAVQALAERVTPAKCARLAEALGLRRVPGPDLSPAARWTCIVTVEAGTLRLEAADESEQIAVWR